MRYIIDESNKLTKELISELKKEDELEFITNELKTTFVFSAIINGLVLKRKVKVIYEDRYLEADKYFENCIVAKSEEDYYKRYMEGKRIAEGTDNYLLPIGSVVKLNDNNIVRIDSHCAVHQESSRKSYTDYAGQYIMHPAKNKEIILFNHENIVEIKHVGYQNEIIFAYLIKMKEYIDNMEIPKKHFELET